MTTVEEVRELTLQDRCDTCSAAARVVATFINGELMFCGHHARDHYLNFKDKAISLLDPFEELATIKQD